jgi:phosphatidate cytidylyltransferase
VSQFLWGSTLGERKILPHVSPNKTVVGLLGGVLNTTILGALTAPYLSPFDTLKGALVGFFIGFAGFAGDIVMSSVKRDMGVKDTSDLIPGHGGILDRVDSLTYTAPVVFYIIYFGWL